MARKKSKPGWPWQKWLSGGALALGVILLGLVWWQQQPALRPVNVAATHPAAVTAPPPPATPKPPPPAPPPQVAVVPPPAPVPGRQAWRRNAVAIGPLDARPMIAIVIDDMGLDRKRSAQVLALPAPLTLSYMAYAKDLPEQAAAAHVLGDELMLHIPMQPQAAGIDPGPNALRTDLDEAEVRRRFAGDLARLDGIVGINNHMGSKFTEWTPGMRIVLGMLHERGLLFLDSRTTPHTVGFGLAGEMDVARAKRDVFLDDDMASPAVAEQLARTEAVARRQGYAIAIGHPHDGTIEALRAWLPEVAGKGFRLVPVSAIVAKEEAPKGGGIVETAE